MRLTYLGHSAVRLQHDGHEVLIDPFLSGNPRAGANPDDLHPDAIVLTHAHGDHVGDTEAIARRTGATVISSHEIAEHFEARGLTTHGMNPGGPTAFPFGRIRFTPAWHSSSFDLEDGKYGGMPMGVVVEMGGTTVYHAGDTALFSDMKLIARHGLDIALLPIGGNYTMDPDDALEAVRFLEAETVVPIHYDTFSLIAQDAHAFAERVEADGSSRCVVLEPGETLAS